MSLARPLNSFDEIWPLLLPELQAKVLFFLTVFEMHLYSLSSRLTREEYRSHLLPQHYADKCSELLGRRVTKEELFPKEVMTPFYLQTIGILINLRRKKFLTIPEKEWIRGLLNHKNIEAISVIPFWEVALPLALSTIGVGLRGDDKNKRLVTFANVDLVRNFCRSFIYEANLFYPESGDDNQEPDEPLEDMLFTPSCLAFFESMRSVGCEFLAEDLEERMRMTVWRNLSPDNEALYQSRIDEGSTALVAVVHAVNDIDEKSTKIAIGMLYLRLFPYDPRNMSRFFNFIGSSTMEECELIGDLDPTLFDSVSERSFGGYDALHGYEYYGFVPFIDDLDEFIQRYQAATFVAQLVSGSAVLNRVQCWFDLHQYLSRTTHVYSAFVNIFHLFNSSSDELKQHMVLFKIALIYLLSRNKSFDELEKEVKDFFAFLEDMIKKNIYFFEAVVAYFSRPPDGSRKPNDIKIFIKYAPRLHKHCSPLLQQFIEILELSKNNKTYLLLYLTILKRLLNETMNDELLSSRGLVIHEFMMNYVIQPAYPKTREFLLRLKQAVRAFSPQSPLWTLPPSTVKGLCQLPSNFSEHVMHDRLGLLVHLGTKRKLSHRWNKLGPHATSLDHVRIVWRNGEFKKSTERAGKRDFSGLNILILALPRNLFDKAFLSLQPVLNPDLKINWWEREEKLLENLLSYMNRDGIKRYLSDLLIISETLPQQFFLSSGITTLEVARNLFFTACRKNMKNLTVATLQRMHQKLAEGVNFFHAMFAIVCFPGDEIKDKVELIDFVCQNLEHPALNAKLKEFYMDDHWSFGLTANQLIRAVIEIYRLESSQRMDAQPLFFTPRMWPSEATLLPRSESSPYPGQ